MLLESGDSYERESISAWIEDFGYEIHTVLISMHVNNWIVCQIMDYSYISGRSHPTRPFHLLQHASNTPLPSTAGRIQPLGFPWRTAVSPRMLPCVGRWRLFAFTTQHRSGLTATNCRRLAVPTASVWMGLSQQCDSRGQIASDSLYVASDSLLYVRKLN